MNDLTVLGNTSLICVSDGWGSRDPSTAEKFGSDQLEDERIFDLITKKRRRSQAATRWTSTSKVSMLNGRLL